MKQASAKKLEHAGSAEKERVASLPQRVSSWQVHQSRLCGKEKNDLFKAPDREVVESQGEREPYQSGSMERKGWTRQ